MLTIEKIKRDKIVAVIRKADEQNIVPIIRSLVKGGIKVVELTAETPNISKIIEKAVNNFGDEITIGAGTVLDPETARTVILAGAEFVVSPTLSEKTIKMTNRYGVLNIPGVLTPNEILTAYEYGATMVKVFPADVFGPHYIKNVRGPLPHVEVMVTGGITLENIQEYFKNGSLAVGIGSNLVNAEKLKTDEDFIELTERAYQYSSMLEGF